MGLIFNWWLIDIAVAIIVLIGSLYLYMKYVFTYWKKKGVPYVEGSFPFGNLGDVMLLRKHFSLCITKLYFELEGHKIGGIFQLHRPTLLLRDPEIIKFTLIKNFSSFQDRGIYYDEKNDPINAHLFFLGGQNWRNLRHKLTPTFSSGKMKMMFHTVLECGQELQDHLKDEANQEATVDVKELIARHSSDVIGSCAFGMKVNCLKNPDAEFRQRGVEFLHPSALLTLGFFLNVMVPSLAAIVKLGRINPSTAKFFQRVVAEMVEYREKNNIVRNDFMQLMIQLKNKGFIEEDTGTNPESHKPDEPEMLRKLTLDEIAAQAFVFFLAGFETSSTTVSFCLYELALNPDIQTRLRTEIDKVLAKHGGQLTYESMQEMEYLDMVLSETMRKYPPLPVLNRECNTNVMLPGGQEVEAGTPVMIPVYALHHDPQYYPNPEQFDPERFSQEKKSKRIHCTYLPFGEGPRVCIGMRFGQMQTKIAMVSLLLKYEFHVCEKTPIPVSYYIKNFTLTSDGGMPLKITNRI